MIRRILRGKSGEGYIDVCVLALCAMLVVALAVRVFPVFIMKNQLDNFAAELVREAEITGRVGGETDRRAAVLREKTGLNPTITWSKAGNIQLNEEVTVTLAIKADLGLFGGFRSFPVTLRARRFTADASIRLEAPVRFGGKSLPPMTMTLKGTAAWTEKF